MSVYRNGRSLKGGLDATARLRSHRLSHPMPHPTMGTLVVARSGQALRAGASSHSDLGDVPPHDQYNLPDGSVGGVPGAPSRAVSDRESADAREGGARQDIILGSAGIHGRDGRMRQLPLDRIGRNRSDPRSSSRRGRDIWRRGRMSSLDRWDCESAACLSSADRSWRRNRAALMRPARHGIPPQTSLLVDREQT